MSEGECPTRLEFCDFVPEKARRLTVPLDTHCKATTSNTTMTKFISTIVIILLICVGYCIAECPGYGSIDLQDNETEPISGLTITLNGNTIDPAFDSTGTSNDIVVDYLTPLQFEILDGRETLGSGSKFEIKVYGLRGYGGSFAAWSDADLPISVTPNRGGIGFYKLLHMITTNSTDSVEPVCEYYQSGPYRFEIVPFDLSAVDSYDECNLCGDAIETEYEISGANVFLLEEFGVIKSCSEWWEDGMDGRLSQTNCQLFRKGANPCDCRIKQDEVDKSGAAGLHSTSDLVRVAVISASVWMCSLMFGVFSL